MKCNLSTCDLVVRCVVYVGLQSVPDGEVFVCEEHVAWAQSIAPKGFPTVVFEWSESVNTQGEIF